MSESLTGPLLISMALLMRLKPEKSKLGVIVSIFGRPTPVELDFIQVTQLTVLSVVVIRLGIDSMVGYRLVSENFLDQGGFIMAKKVIANIKLQIKAGKATPSPPIGPALGQHGVNIMEFCKAYNAKTQNQEGMIIPVVITVYADRSFTFITKTPPASVLLKQAAKIAKGSGSPKRDKVGRLPPSR